jgi:hypothetical protein
VRWRYHFQWRGSWKPRFPGSQFLGGQDPEVQIGLTGLGASSVQIHRGLQSHLHFSQDLSSQCSDPLVELCTIQGGHLVTHCKARLWETAGPARNLDDSGTSPTLRGRPRNRDYDDRPPAWSLIETVVGNDDHGTPSRLLGTGSCDQIRPMNFASLHLDALPVVTRCSTPAASNSSSRSKDVPAACAANATIAS